MDIDPDANFPNTYIKLVVDGQAHIITTDPINPTNTAWPMQQYIEQYLADKLAIYPVESSTVVGIGAKGNQNIRLELGAGSDLGYGIGSYSGTCRFINGFDTYTTENPNPTIIEENDLGVSTVCLSPFINQISCAGATSTMNFSHLSQGWMTEVDGVFFGSDDPTYVVRTDFEGVIGVNNDGYAYFSNMNSQPHRIKFTPMPDYDYIPSYTLDPETTNPSFMELEDGSIVFCLAPVADCTPSEPLQLLSAGNDLLIDSESGVKHDRVDYRLNGGDVQTFTASNEATTVWHVLDELQTELGMVAGTDGHWVFGNNAQGAAFTFGGSGNNPLTIFSAGKAGTDLDVPTTLELIFRDHQDDFVSYVIAWEDFKPMVGDNIGYSVILHACGVSEFA